MFTPRVKVRKNDFDPSSPEVIRCVAVCLWSAFTCWPPSACPVPSAGAPYCTSLRRLAMWQIRFLQLKNKWRLLVFTTRSFQLPVRNSTSHKHWNCSLLSIHPLEATGAQHICCVREHTLVRYTDVVSFRCRFTRIHFVCDGFHFCCTRCQYTYNICGTHECVSWYRTCMQVLWFVCVCVCVYLLSNLLVGELPCRWA